MKKDIVEFVARCLNCQHVKYEHQRPGVLLQQMPIPEWKWERITIDFIVGLPQTLRKFDAIWVIMDRLTKSAHFIRVVTTYTSERLAQIYIREIVRLNGMPVSIILDRGPQFTSHFWRAIQEFAYNNSYQSSIEMAPFEALYGRQCHSPIGWLEPGETKLYGTDLVQDALDKLDESLSYEEEPVAIIDRQDRQLRSKRISMVKVQWRGQSVEEGTWESEEDMRSRYPHLFSTSGTFLCSFEDERLFKRWRM
ncbi:uncharacterized protein [Nicotiana sylvestris]|uniref:uncharacterized protein n=1 Tax=Nicotiana sylvestris TaxID=4096 RepID=UPI00388CB3ED